MRAAAAIFATLSLAVAWAGPAAAADLHATPSTFKSVFTSAKTGDTVYVASGSYGTFTGAVKSGRVIIKPEAGATPTMSVDFDPAANITVDGFTLTGVELGDSRTHDITIANSNVTGQTILHTGELANANVLLDHNVHANWTKCNGCSEARVWLPERTSQPSGITIQNSQFGPGGMSDGIQNGSNGTKILNNVFFGLQEGSADGVHTDAIQLYGSQNTLIRGNYFHDVPDAIMAPDGTDHETIEHNVFAADDQFDYPYAITLWADKGSIIRHNTMLYGSCAFNLKCGLISLGSKSGSATSTGTVIRDNIFTGTACCGDLSSAGYSTDHNLTRTNVTGTANVNATPTYVGGTHPTTLAGFALAAGSPGKGTASDGTDVGADVTIGAGAPGTPGTPATPDPPVDPTPPADTTAPDTSITSGPSGTITATTASYGFSASESGSTFECKVDSSSWGTCASPKATGTLASGAHTFSVRATDTAGNTDSSPATRSVTVSPAPAADTTAPDTTIGAGPSGVVTTATPSFAFTATESGSTFRCKIDAGSWATCASPKATGTLADGAHTFSVRATDAAGNTDGSPATRGFTVDTTAPTSQITSAPSGTTEQTGGVVEFTSDDETATFACRVDAGAWGPCMSPFTVSGLAFGQHTVAVRATDAVGNTEAAGADATWTVTAVTTTTPPPVVTPPVVTAPTAPIVPPVVTAPTAPTVPTAPTAPSAPSHRPTTHAPAKHHSRHVNLHAPRTVKVKRGRFQLPCGKACRVVVTSRVRGRVISVARGNGSSVALTGAGTAALRNAGVSGLTATVSATSRSAFQQSTSHLRAG